MYKTIIEKVQEQHPVIFERTRNNGFQDGPALFFKSIDTGRECMVTYPGASYWFIDTPTIDGGTELFDSGDNTSDVAKSVVKAIGRA